MAPSAGVAWDCATGTGQAARGLATRFARVVATDASTAQLSQAEADPRIEYRFARAEDSGLPPHSADIITVAQALHWLDPPRFYREARRVLVPRGILAVWGYGDPVIEGDEANAIVHAYNRGTIESFWLPERQLLLDGYRTVDFPFDEINPPSFGLEQRWSLSELGGYLRTWSATARYAAELGSDPIIEVERNLSHVWGDPDAKRLISWPLYVRAGRAS
ncbi:MAG TPA: class I SAM-dependent methyltransferase [Gemmatimonadaceae bacterium]